MATFYANQAKRLNVWYREVYEAYLNDGGWRQDNFQGRGIGRGCQGGHGRGGIAAVTAAAAAEDTMVVAKGITNHTLAVTIKVKAKAVAMDTTTKSQARTMAVAMGIILITSMAECSRDPHRILGHRIII